MQKNELGIDLLEKVVKETALAIRTGNLSIMGELASRTVAALAKIDSETDEARIEALLSLAQRNAVALEAAGRGVRAARRRFTEILSVRAGVQTYDNAGNTQKIGGPLASFKARL